MGHWGKTLGHLGAFTLCLASMGCDGHGVFGMSCSEAGCGSALMVTVPVAGPGVELGVTALNLEVDGVAGDCEVSVEQMQQPQDCGQGVQAMLERTAVCTSETHADGAESESCRPDGGFAIRVTAGGTPAVVSLEIVDDAGAATRFDLTPQYETFFPNGPDCEPACDEAHIELEPLSLQLGDGGAAAGVADAGP
ncbi:MAG: hypothetical protein OEZ06_17745 [Myxococcales bacterium]|nr:hypothetical protein [Myxococcales bacterium]